MPYTDKLRSHSHQQPQDPSASSTPIQNSSRTNNIRSSIQDTTNFLRELNSLEKSTSVQNLSSLFNISEPIMEAETFYNKELAELMTANIPKFDLDSITNPAIQLRSFIKACKNVLDIYGNLENNQVNTDFFKLIKFRLGYNVQERITKHNFQTLQDFEDHLRSICHIKLNKGKLLSEIRHERQHPTEDVSHFVERLRKLIAQGRSEYSNDREFEREAIHTLKNAVKNELISIKLMDSATDNFEELAEIAISRDSELHQRAYKTNNKVDPNISQDIINELLQKIKNLETNQTANINNIHYQPRYRPNSPTQQYQSKSPQNYKFCNYCKRRGHVINECRTRAGKNNYSKNQNSQNYRNQSHQYFPKNRYTNNPNNKFHNPENKQYSPFDNNTKTTIDKCVRCHRDGHKSNNCYAIICSICKTIGHSYAQCPNSSPRRVHFHENPNVSSQEQTNDSGNV